MSSRHQDKVLLHSKLWLQSVLSLEVSQNARLQPKMLQLEIEK